MGTDALKLDTFPPGKWIWPIRIVMERIVMKLIEPLTSEHWIVHERLRKHLLSFGIADKKIKVVVDPPLYPDPIAKIKHDYFTVLFYCPPGTDNKFTSWKYGLDVYMDALEQLELDSSYPIKFIQVDGTEDMKDIYAITDCYVRPSRHDGEPRMILECKINNIPYYYSEDGKPDADDLIKFIEEQYERQRKRLDSITT
jgi:hypothetical protein